MKCINNDRHILYIDGALDSEEEKRIEKHLSECPRCRNRLQELRNRMQRLMREMEKLEPVSVPDIPAATIEQAARRRTASKKAGTSIPTGTRSIPPLLLRVAGIVIAVMAAVYFLSTFGPPPETNSTAGIDSDFKTNGAKGNQFVIHSVKMEEKPAQAYIIQEKEDKISIVWVEKM